MDPRTAAPASEPKPVTQPVMDILPRQTETVRTAPPEAPTPVSATPPPKAKPMKPAKVQKPKQPRTGVGLAVTATIIIILGLAALMTYAYLRTQGISVL